MNATTNKPVERDVSGPRSLTRLLALFEVLSPASDGLSLAELSVLLGSPKSSLLNLLRPLVAEGFLFHDGSVYRLGPAIYRLASEVLNAWYLPRVMRPVMEQLAKQSGESVMLSVVDVEKALLTYVDTVNSPHPVRYQISVGTVRPLYASVAGRVLLAHADRGWRQKYLTDIALDSALALPLTKASLKREVEQIQQQGVGCAVDVYATGLSAVAAPIFGGDGRCVACLNIAGPTERFSDALERLTALVRAAAAKGSKAVAAAEALPTPVAKLRSRPAQLA
ncbi:MAG: transcriptional regulator, IclR family [Ramlibacter sp.]|jgi:DNA-binding IclR family transcriptional regulator|nr:transcriptional regulator, IclR family [Ramlibacter sp.]